MSDYTNPTTDQALNAIHALGGALVPPNDLTDHDLPRLLGYLMYEVERAVAGATVGNADAVDDFLNGYAEAVGVLPQPGFPPIEGATAAERKAAYSDFLTMRSARLQREVDTMYTASPHKRVISGSLLATTSMLMLCGKAYHPDSSEDLTVYLNAARAGVTEATTAMDDLDHMVKTLSN